MTRRTDQVSSVLHRAVQTVIEAGLSDPRLSGALITVTEVKVTPDLLTAIVNVTVTPEKREGIVIHGLTAASRHIRRRAGDLVEMRKLPELVFKVDKGRKRQAEVMQVLAELAAERQDPDAPASDQPDSPRENDQ
ncbi:MAG: 30S ribosome-binding factor RbfA [Phycisphaerales bacterium]|nr:30S ribosome-binding factor RbfA [Phycisphaerales bacterium]